MRRFVHLFNHLGPGIVAASAAIGTSHLVQSTRAGGYYGFELLWVVILINLLKYPFIENGFRYAGATGENLLTAYHKLNKYYLIFFLLINLVAAIGGIALLLYVTGGIAKSVLGLGYDVKMVSFGVMLASMALVIFESYDVFDRVMKVFMILLFFSTLFAVGMAIFHYDPANSKVVYQTSAWTKSQLPFVVALMGWMPGPIELGAWYSLWFQAKNRGQYRLDFKAAKLDFNFGYVLVIVTAVFFVTLGALVLHSSGELISKNPSVFAAQLVSIYTSTIGAWSELIIGLAMLTTILSTTITLIDIYPRSISVSMQILMNTSYPVERVQRKILTSVFCGLSYLIIHYLVSDLTTIADIVTASSFLFAPFFAFLNYQVVNSKLLPKRFRPHWMLKVLSMAGFAFMIGFDVVFLYVEFF